ncbi:TPA: phage tail tip protein [Escherichia coli]
MAILDDVIGVFSPGWKAARLRSRAVIQAYEAVKTTRTHKARRENRTADQLSQYGAVSLREQARYLDNNHDLVIGVFDKLEERVVGKNGIIVEPHPVLRNGAIARDLAAEIRTRWSEWSVSPEVTGQFTRPMLERLMLRTWLRDGEVFAQMVSGRINSLTPSAGVHFWLEALEPDFIPMTTDESNRLNQGVFVDDWGRPEKYLVYKSRPVAASINIRPGHDYYFYVRSVNTVGKSAFVEAVGRASDDAEGYLDFFKGQITESHLGKELLEKVELTEDNASKLEEFSKEWKDASDKWNAMWGVKIEQTKDGKHYVAGIGLSMEDTEEGKLSQFLVAANRIAFIDPSNGNTRPMFVGQGDQIFMNDVFLKRLTAPTITSGGNPPAFSLTPDGRLTAKNADISGNVNANSGTLNNVTINENCRVLGKLSANQIEGDLVKTVGKAFPRDSRAPERWPSGTITVRVYDDQPFDRQIVIPAVAFSGAKHEREHTDIYSSCRLIVRKNGAEIYNRTALDNTLIYSGVIDMPAGHGHMTLEFSVSAWLVNDWYPTASISDLLVVVMKKATAGISIS